MRRLLVLIAVLLASFAQAQNFITKSFDAEFAILPNGTVSVVETIAVRFTIRQRGLIRKLPFSTKSKAGQTRVVEYSNLSVDVDRGGGFQSAQKRQSTEGGDLSLRIGSPDVWISGDATYRIRYDIAGALTPVVADNVMGARTEFLWNLLPTHWPTPIPSGTLTITYPEPEEGPVVVRVLAGDRGTRQGLQLQYGGTSVGRSAFIDLRFENKRKVVVDLKAPLGAGQVVTADLALPEGTVETSAPVIYEPGQDRAQPGRRVELPRGSPWLGLIPLIGAGLVWLISRPLWGAREKPLVVKFEPPPGIGPSLSGTVIDNVVNPRDVVAGIVSLAQKGAIRMHHVQGSDGMHLQLLGLARSRDVDLFEQALYAYLEPFGPVVTPEILRGSFGQYFQMLEQMLRQEALDRGLFTNSAASKSGLGCLLVLVTVVATFLLCAFSPAAILGGIASLVLGFIFIGKISYVTPQGQNVRREIQGLQEFISRAHQHELNYMANTDPGQALFEKLLPYAIAFNAVQQWTKAFEGIDIQMPEWYDSGGMGFTDMIWMSMLMNDLGHLNNDYGDAMTYVPPATSFGTGDGFSSGDSGFGGGWSDGGGGFDGGFSGGDGGGGGGGDSW